MKKLMRMKLINWHRFQNITIDFGSSTLLSGENGAGKSTLLDAIQFVVTCSTNYFNKAAHENGKRKLTGYVRCKTGKENRPYERTGAISAHIALEFYEESKAQYFIVGAVIDSASEGQETTVRYLIDNARLTEELFLVDNTPKTITQFRSTAKGIKQWAQTQVEGKKLMKTRFGRIEDKFFRLIPKAMAFKPIDDIKDFVYSYVLDEKEVNIETLRENVRSYQDLERTLNGVKERMKKLEQIDRHHETVLNCMKKDSLYEYFLARAELDLTLKKIKVAKANQNAEQYRLESINQEIKYIEEEKEQKQEMETSLRVELSQNQEFLALEEQKKNLEKLLEQERERFLERDELRQSIKTAKGHVYQLKQIKDVDACILSYEKMLEEVEKKRDTADVKRIIEDVISYKKVMFERISEKRAELEIRLNGQKHEKKELLENIEQLKRKRLRYPEAVECVKAAVEQEFKRLGREPVPRVLCELLEITDDKWRNAVEGYLNTQRFYILVEPECFDIALGTYDRLRREKKAFGVGLINAKKLEGYDVAESGTLASVVTSKNIHARRFINMVLGKVHLCERFEDLKKYPVSITWECMKYQNHVASAILPSIFENPYIGANALKVQLELSKLQLQKLNEQIKADEERKANLDQVLPWLSTDQEVDIKYRIDVIPRLFLLADDIQKCKLNIKTLEKNSNMIQKQLQLQVLEEQRKELENSFSTKNRQAGIIERKIEEIGEDIEQNLGEQLSHEARVVELLNDAGDEAVSWNGDYEKQNENKSVEQFKENYERRRKANLTSQSIAEKEMFEKMLEYKTAHDFGAPATMAGFPEFAAVYDRLRTSELLNYEDKVGKAKQAAEEEFREQFLAKLQENMKQAQSEFKELNKALKDIAFSNEKYEFLHMPSKRYRHYYEMIMDDFNAMQGESIFSGMFHENHKEVIDELFAKLALDGDNEAKALDEFVDYRTYMDYDIRILHSDGSHSFYSKVCEEKSGGETQTPFYVTVAASFVQLYANNIGGEAIGLVMFDEAFNNMDDERIGGVLEFFRRLPLQTIIAAPPDKIQYIGPSMETTLLVLTDEKISYVEEYYNGSIPETNSESFD